MILASAAHSAAYNLGSWDTFFVLTGTAGATLTGLFFIAFSMRVQDLQLSRCSGLGRVTCSSGWL